MKKLKRNARVAVAVLAVMAPLFIIAMVVAIAITAIGPAEKAEPSNTTAGKIIVMSTAETSVPEEFGVLTHDKNTIVKIDGSLTSSSWINFRYNPDMSDKELAGKVQDGTEFMVDVLYLKNDFVGFSAKQAPFYPEKSDSDGILWVHQNYLHWKAYEFPENADMPKNLKVLEGDKNVRFIDIIKDSPKLRSTPSSKDNTNIYGTIFQGASIEVSALYVDETYSWYGIKVEDFNPNSYRREGFGHLEEDLDGIVWVSALYAELKY